MSGTDSERNIDSIITISCTSEYPDYVCSENHDIWALVSLAAPCYVEGGDDDRAGVDIVVVMDKSGSMKGEKLILVKRMLEFMLTQLTEKDRLSLITYDTDVYVDFGLMNMSGKNKKYASNKIKNIHEGSMTNLSGGLIEGLMQIMNRPSGGQNNIASVLLFTDGLANQGITDAEAIIASMKNTMKVMKKFDSPSQMTRTHRTDSIQAPSSWLRRVRTYTSHVYPGGTSPGEIWDGEWKISSSPPVCDTEESPRDNDINTVPEATVYTFGFGSDHDADMLKCISDAGNGMYYFIETEEEIIESFAHCVGGLMSTVAQDIQFEIHLQDGVRLKEVHTARPCEIDGNRKIKLNIGDLQRDENRDIGLELSLGSVNLSHNTTLQHLFNVNVDYFNVITNNLESATGKLDILRPVKVTVHDKSRVNAKLVKERERLDMTRVMKEAGERAAVGDFHASKTILIKHIKQMKSCKYSLIRAQNLDMDYLKEYDAMMEDLYEYQATSISAHAWNMKGKKLKCNLIQQYDNQRSNALQARLFNSKWKKSNVLKSKAFIS